MSKVQEFIDLRGLRKDWIADHLNISPSYLTLLVQGKKPWTVRLKTGIAEILGVPEAILFADECPSSAPIKTTGRNGGEVTK